MSLFRFEHHTRPVASSAVFAGRVAANVLASTLIIGVALFAGMAGYRITEGMDWLDAFLNAAMLLGGMGPVTALATSGGKLFAGAWEGFLFHAEALYAVLIMMTFAGTGALLWCFRVQPVSLPAALRWAEPLLLLMSRYTLWIYVFHLAILQY